MGVRRGRPGLSSLRSLVLVGLALGSSACQSLSDEDQARLAVFRENSQHYYDRGDYARALHQASSALELDPEITSVRLVKGFCLLKLGKQAGSPRVIDESLKEFAAIADTRDARDDFRVYLGLGSAHLARALLAEDAIERIQTRMTSQFLSAAGRQDELLKLERARALRKARLEDAEPALRRALSFELQKNNLFGLVDLVLVLHSLGGREQEAAEFGERAIALLNESSRVTANSLKRNAALSPVQRLDLENRIENNREKERQLRDLLATILLDLGDVSGFLQQMQALESAGLMAEVQYFNRAQVHEDIGLIREAIDDLKQYLRLRSRRLDFEEDEMAPMVFDRIDALRARSGVQPGR